MNNVQRNEIHVSKLITEMPKLKMSHNARLVLYTVLKKSWQTFRNRNNYISKDILSPEDIEEAQKPVTLQLSDLKPLFRLNATFKEIKEHILTIPYEAQFKTNIDLQGKKVNEVFEVKISLFKKVVVGNKSKTITFMPSENLIEYIEALKTFAKVDIEEMRKLKGNYQIRGYELICQNNYRDKNNNKLVDDEVRKIRIADLRRYFEVPDTYTTGDIDRRVLEPLKKSINQNTKYNITNIKKYKLDPENKCKVSHYRIDVEYKEKYLKEVKEKSNNNVATKTIELNNVNNTEKDTPLEFFNKVWALYPLRKGKADIEITDMTKLQEFGYEEIKTCIDRYKDYINEKKKEGFNQSYQGGYKFFTKGYIDYLDENYTPYKAQPRNNTNNGKPVQATNFEQREYDDEFFDNLYENF